MPTRETKPAELHTFTESLKSEIRAWLRDSDVRQKELAAMLDVTESTVSANLRKNHTMTEAFVRRLSSAVPQFSQAIYTYFELKNGKALPPVSQEKVDTKRKKAEKVAVLRKAEKEVIKALQALTDAAVKAVESD